MKISHYGRSDIGTRKNNEDIIFTMPNYNFYSIADGMGGHQAGEIAAKEATLEVYRSIVKNLHPKNSLSIEDIFNHLNQAIINANKKVFILGKEYPSFKGMGTTLSCIYFYKNSLIFAHVGDSRIYLFRENELKQLTKDHSLFNEFSTYEKIKKDKNKYKNIITKAIGAHHMISPDIEHHRCFLNDKYIICSDGLSDFIDENEIKEIILKSPSKKIAVKDLIKKAKKNGSKDNISTLFLEVSQ